MKITSEILRKASIDNLFGIPEVPFSVPSILNFAGQLITGGVRLTWESSANYETEIWQSVDEEAMELLATVAPDVGVYEHYLAGGVTSNYKARFKQDQTVLNIPSGLTVTQISGGVRLTWSDNNTEAEQIEVWVNVNDGGYVLLATVDVGVETRDHTVANGTMKYRLRAKSGTLPVYSDYTSEVSYAIKPILQSITVENADPDVIVLTYDLPLNGAIVPAINVYSCSGRTVSGTVTISGVNVYVPVSNPFIFGDEFTLSYTKPVSNPVQSTYGGQVDSFTDVAITNNVEEEVETYEAETNALLARYVSEPTTELKDLINYVIRQLKLEGLFSMLDALYIMGLHTNQAACQNWIKNAHNMTEVGSPTFTAKQGFTGTGSSYLDLDFIPSSDGVNFTQNNNSFFFLMGSIGATNSRYIVVSTPPALGVLLTDASNVRMYNNSNTNYQPYAGMYNTEVLYTTCRTNSGDIYTYADGDDQVYNALATTGFSSAKMYLLANADISKNYCTGQIRIFGMGAYMTQAQVQKLNDIFEYFMANVGGTF